MQVKKTSGCNPISELVSHFQRLGLVGFGGLAGLVHQIENQLVARPN
jgi:chromate transport protein ChrA